MLADTFSPQLIQSAGRGNLIAIYQVFAETRDQAYFAARQYLGEEKDIAAVLGDAYLQSFSRIQEYNFQQPFALFLQQKIAYRAVRQLKAKKVSFAVKDAMPAPFDDRELFPEEWLDQPAKRQMILQQLSALPQNQKAAAIMHYMAGMAPFQIAAAMGVDERDAAFHLSAAKNGLRSPAAQVASDQQDLPPVMTRLLEIEALAFPMPRDTAKTVFEQMAMIYLTGQKVPKEGKISASSASAAPSVTADPEQGGGLVRSLVIGGIVLALVVGGSIFYKLRWDAGERKVREDILSQYEQNKIAAQLPDDDETEGDPFDDTENGLDPEDQPLDLDGEPDDLPGGEETAPGDGEPALDTPDQNPDDPGATPEDGGMEEEPLPEQFRDDNMDGGFQENPIGT